jgi:hypothetical protein
MSSLPLTKRANLWLSKFPLRINRWYHSDFGRNQFNAGGIDVTSEDWDNLLILDACRYDVFEETHDLPGTLDRAISKSSTTDEFMRANIDGRDLRDTVYVTASPSVYATEDVDVNFHHIEHVWADDWDAELRTVHPADVTARAIDVHERYSDKRLFVHYLQPHYPFIGETGRSEFRYDGYEEPLDPDGDTEKFWDTVGTRINDVSTDTVWKAYVENLKAVLPYVEELITTVSGRSVVTADHGEMIGDRAFPVPNKLHGHPGGLYTPELVEVPWLTYTNGSRRRTVAGGSSDERDDIERSVVKERLADLGYAE